MTSKIVARYCLTALMVGIGALHFLHPTFFVKIVPSYLPDAALLVAVSGFFEVLGGVGLLIPQIRRPASLGLIALYIAVFPANVNMAVHADHFSEFPAIALWMRLPLQIGLIAWAWWVGLSSKETA